MIFIRVTKGNKHGIFGEVTTSKSYASYLLLKQDLIERSEIDLNSEYVFYDVHNVGKKLRIKTKDYIRIKHSRTFLSFMKEKMGKLCCVYCGKDNLIVELGRKIKKTTKASIDHIVPVSKKGDLFDSSNLVCSCQYCNEKKGSKDLKNFIKTYNIDINVVKQRIDEFQKIAKTFKYDEQFSKA